VGRAAPCHSAPDFSTGAFFGALIFLYVLGLPTLFVGAILGAMIGGFVRGDPQGALADAQDYRRDA
jgi:hypothetical protein